jgi:hypothetical protein
LGVLPSEYGNIEIISWQITVNTYKEFLSEKFKLRNRYFARVNQFMLTTVECLKVLFLYPKERGRYLTSIT